MCNCVFFFLVMQRILADFTHQFSSRVPPHTPSKALPAPLLSVIQDASAVLVDNVEILGLQRCLRIFWIGTNILDDLSSL